MPINQTQRNKIAEFFNEKGVGECPSCGAGASSMTIGPDPVALFTVEGKIVREDNAVLLIALVCNNCAHVRLFHAHTLGVDVEGEADRMQSPNGT